MLKPKLLAIALIASLALLGCETDEDDTAEEPEAVQQQDDQADEEEVEQVEQQDQADEEEAGLMLPNMGEPTDGIITSSQPEEEDFEALADEGVGLIISLREEDEDGYVDGAEKAEELGMEYVSIPVDPDEGFTADNAEKLAEALGDAEDDALVHCGTSERASGLLALKTYLEGEMERDEALELGEAGGLDELREVVEEAMGG